MEEAKAHELYLDLKKADRAAKAKKGLGFDSRDSEPRQILDDRETLRGSRAETRKHRASMGVEHDSLRRGSIRSLSRSRSRSRSRYRRDRSPVDSRHRHGSTHKVSRAPRSRSHDRSRTRSRKDRRRCSRSHSVSRSPSRDYRDRGSYRSRGRHRDLRRKTSYSRSPNRRPSYRDDSPRRRSDRHRDSPRRNSRCSCSPRSTWRSRSRSLTRRPNSRSCNREHSRERNHTHAGSTSQKERRPRPRSPIRQRQQEDHPSKAAEQEAQPIFDFAAAIEGYDQMTPALRLRAKTRFMLQQVTTRAEHSDGQWTRFKFNSNHDADEGDMKLDTAELKGYSNAAGTVGTSHEAAIFGLPERSRGSISTATGVAKVDSDSDADDPPQVVELPNEIESISTAEVTTEESQPKPTWREKLALMQAKRATEH